MYGGGNRIYGRRMIKHKRQFAKCKILEIFQGLCGPRTRKMTCKLVFEDPRLSSRTTSLPNSQPPRRIGPLSPPFDLATFTTADISAPTCTLFVEL